MSVTLHELYFQTIRPLSEQQRLELMALIANDLARPRSTDELQESPGKKLADLFGSANLGYATGIDNEQIDADLAWEYANTHANTHEDAN